MNNKSVVCTLFEGHYHFGVAALSNSLYKNGFRGSIYIGFRGILPHWTEKAIANLELGWENAKTLKVVEGLELNFLPLNTNYHLTNYKPDFMLELLAGPAKNAEGIYYFDPDIVLVAPFVFLVEWIDCGVAVCEDVNSPLQKFHPRRVAWRRYFRKYNLDLTYKNQIYVNGGFIGVRKCDFHFLNIWKNVQELMGHEIGGLNRSAFDNYNQLFNPLSNQLSGDYAPFCYTDQDALNAAIEVHDGNVSYTGKAAMSFSDGLALMPHALGHSKPWLINPLVELLKGDKPRRIDKEFWNIIDYPIKAFSSGKVKRMKFTIKISAFLSRLYGR